MNTEGIGVLVGVDESADSQEALAWAVADAVALQVPLTIATVVDVPRLGDVPVSAELLDSAELAARHRVDLSVARAADLARDVPVRGRPITGDPAAELLLLAGGADEVVVGSHGTGAFSRLLIGSVSNRVAEHATCPVVVVRGERNVGRVVVGIDESPHSDAALDYGFAYADRHGAQLVAMHVYTVGAFVYPMPPYPVPPYPVTEELARMRAEATRNTEHRLGRWTEKYPEVDASVEVSDGRAAHDLVEASRTAGLLVVGTRGHGGLAGMLLGSVSQAVLRHAHSPVVVAR